MLFHEKEHKEFYEACLKRIGRYDSYHRALFYTLGIDKECRNHVNEIYDFDECHIKLSALECSWHTSGSFETVLLGFNLFNGYIFEDNPAQSTPYSLFASEYINYYLEAIKIRYSDYLKDKSRRVTEK